jgi:S1-C subfamily serine protease
MRWLVAVLALLGFLSTASAQSRPPGYFEAERAFSSLSTEDRIALQVVLTANGYWPAVPNVNFNNRLFEAILTFQSVNGYSANGVIDKQQLDRLIEVAAPILSTYGFRSIPHPTRGHPIWVPVGLGLVAKRDADGLNWTNAQRSISMSYSYFPSTDLNNTYQRTLTTILNGGGQVHYRVLRQDFYVISVTTGNGIDGYYRFHRDGDGILGFFIFWNKGQDYLHSERMTTLISASLWSTMTGAPFIKPITPSPPPSDEAVAVARPTEPVVPPSQTPEPSSLPGPATLPTPAAKEGPKEKGTSSGTGFFVSQEGHILTNAHVVEGCSAIHVRVDGGDVAEGRVLTQDKANDLALLRTNLKPTKVAAFRIGIRLGEAVAAFGYPLNTLLSSSGNFTLGNVTALSGLRDDSRYLQVSAPVQPGNSGGPLLDQNGNVVGVVSAKLNALNVMVATNGDIPQNVNFAIKGTLVASFLESNRVPLEQGTATRALSSADLADQSKLISVFIKCE